MTFHRHKELESLNIKHSETHTLNLGPLASARSGCCRAGHWHPAGLWAPFPPALASWPSSHSPGRTAPFLWVPASPPQPQTRWQGRPLGSLCSKARAGPARCRPRLRSHGWAWGERLLSAQLCQLCGRPPPLRRGGPCWERRLQQEEDAVRRFSTSGLPPPPPPPLLLLFKQVFLPEFKVFWKGFIKTKICCIALGSITFWRLTEVTATAEDFT